MPSGKMDLGTCFLIGGMWFGKVVVKAGAMIEQRSWLKRDIKGGTRGKEWGEKDWKGR